MLQRFDRTQLDNFCWQSFADRRSWHASRNYDILCRQTIHTFNVRDSLGYELLSEWLNQSGVTEARDIAYHPTNSIKAHPHVLWLLRWIIWDDEIAVQKYHRISICRKNSLFAASWPADIQGDWACLRRRSTVDIRWHYWRLPRRRHYWSNRAPAACQSMLITHVTTHLMMNSISEQSLAADAHGIHFK